MPFCKRSSLRKCVFLLRKCTSTQLAYISSVYAYVLWLFVVVVFYNTWSSIKYVFFWQTASFVQYGCICFYWRISVSIEGYLFLLKDIIFYWRISVSIEGYLFLLKDICFYWRISRCLFRVGIWFLSQSRSLRVFVCEWYLSQVPLHNMGSRTVHTLNAPCPSIKYWSEDGSSELQHVANCILCCVILNTSLYEYCRTQRDGSYQNFSKLRFEIKVFSTPVGFWIFLWVVNECSVVAVCQCFGETSCFQLQLCKL